MKKSMLTTLAGTALLATMALAPSRAEAQSASITASATVATALAVSADSIVRSVGVDLR